MELRDYQIQIISDIIEVLKKQKRCCVALATGGGKTVIFSSLLNHLQGKTLICVHREELVHQTSKTVKLEHDLIIPGVKHITNDVVIAMVQTLHNRLKKQQININDFDNIIIDEAHRGEFMKILSQYNGNVIGFTATPNYEKTRYFYKCLSCGGEHEKFGDCCGKDTKKYKENVPLSKYYHTLINGIDISELIDRGYLVKDDNYTLENDTSELVYSERLGDYTQESISLVFGSYQALRNTVEVYKKLALGKKTILFNPNTLVNEKLYHMMLREGFNVKMYDSRNETENRHDLVEWFKNTPDAILLNVQVFTTGFDCTDVEVVFLNKKTKSINLFLQMVGRGGRITDKIFKPSFKVIDLGNNVKDFGAWSDKRNWNQYFYNHEVVACGTPLPAAIRICHKCEKIIAANSIYCPECGAERIYTGGVVGLPKINGKPTLPPAYKIIEYCEKNNLDLLAARKIIYDSFSMMCQDYSYQSFLKHKNSGELFERVKFRLTKEYYFHLNASNLKGNRIIKIEHFANETIRHIERRYHPI